MLNEAIVTSLQEGAKLVVVLVDNRGYASIGGLSRSLGTEGFGTQFSVATDLAANAESLGAHVIRARGVSELRDALAAAKKIDRTVVIHIEADPITSVPSYESWWEVPVAETSETSAVRDARKRSDEAKRKQRRYL
jgi:3D-(3,5/4)-trihydroxycyclohexane-1,2-dione acylhydrolase (decyclizing)